MKIISTSYISTPEFIDPVAWLNRISFYTGILEELAKQHELVSIESINYEGQYDQNGVRYIFLKDKKRNIRVPWRMHQIIADFRPDAVLINGLIFPLQVMQLRLKLGWSVKIIVLHRAEKPFNGLKRYFQKFADNCINAYLFSSAEFGKQWMQKGNIRNPGKVHEVMQASSHFRPENTTLARSVLHIAGSPVFLWVGRLDINKDPQTVVNAFIRFLEHEPSATLYMIYQTEDLLQAIIEQVTENNKAREAIHLIGKSPHCEMNKWYNAADFIVSGSHYEGSGIAICEAMSCGCIPILTNIPSFRTMLGNGKFGFLYDPGNEKELLSILQETQKLDLASEKEKVLEHFHKELSFEAIAVKISRVIDG